MFDCTRNEPWVCCDILVSNIMALRASLDTKLFLFLDYILFHIHFTQS